MSTDQGTPRDYGDFKADLGRLARHLAEAHATEASLFLSDKAKQAGGDTALVCLALDHLARHDRGSASGVEQCEKAGQPCKTLGAAQVVLEILHSTADERSTVPEQSLHKAIAEADRALAALASELATYDDAQTAREMTAPQILTRAHNHSRRLTSSLAETTKSWRLFLARVDARSVRPQIPDHLTGSEARGLLTSLEVMLDANGWAPDEIIEILDDKRGGDSRRRKDRLRHRITEHHEKQRRTRHRGLLARYRLKRCLAWLHHRTPQQSARRRRARIAEYREKLRRARLRRLLVQYRARHCVARLSHRAAQHSAKRRKARLRHQLARRRARRRRARLRHRPTHRRARRA